jgi:hypothetical protein
MRLLVVLVAAFVLVGCNQDDDTDMGTQGATLPPTATEEATTETDPTHEEATTEAAEGRADDTGRMSESEFSGSLSSSAG